MTTPHLPTGSRALHEREREIALLDQALLDAKADESRLVLIEGQAGIGKSRLLLEMRRMAEAAGFAVVIARGYEFERDYAFGMLRQLISNAQRDVSESEILNNANAADELMAAFGADEGEAANTFTIFEGCYWATIRAAETIPILIAIDDLQWCDRPSLEYLAYLARRIESQPIVIAATVRPADSSAGAAAVRELMSDPNRLSISPHPLGSAAAGAMTAERLGHESPDNAFVDEMVTITGGNPLLIDELLKELAAEGVEPTADNVAKLRELGPRAASRSVLLRLARLDQPCTDIARALTIFGEGASDALLSEFTGLDEQAIADAIAKNVQAEILRDDQPLGFVHPLVREAIYADIPAGERELMHLRAARQLDAGGESSQRIAAQLINVPPRGDEWVADKLRHAGSIAMSRGIVSAAVSYYSRAYAEPVPKSERADLLRDLGIAEALANKLEGADHLIEAWNQLDDPVQRGFIAVILLRLLSLAQRNQEGVEIAERTLEQLGPEQDALRQRIQNGLVSISLMDPAVRPFELIADLLDDARNHGDSVEARMYDGAMCYGKMLRNDPAEECVELALRAVSDDSLHQFDNAGFPWIGAVVTLAVADDPRALDVCDRSLAAAGQGGAVYVPAVARGFKGWALMLRGDLQGAFEVLELAKADVELFDLRLGYTQVAAMLTLACVEQGDLARAERELEFGEAHVTPGTQRIIWLGAKLHLLVEQGKNEEAVAVCELIEAAGMDQMIENPAWLPWRSLKAEALDGLDRTDEALVLAAAEVEAARRWGAPKALGRALRIHGQLKRRKGMAEIEESVAILKDSPAILEYGWSLAALGTALRHERKSVEAREPLGEALEIAARAGAVGLERHVKDEIAATGAAPRVTDFQGMDALTPSEKRVAGLAVEGMTNREIAQSLFVTPKTIEVHLSNVYRKLDVKSRRELPGVFVAEAA
ncbi:MAG: AAA family ATPase [Thermoleophilaceae bacterium]|nr:AAA family ATPase [Thermoleophilaceae bacterium]